jgi:hypothetical protein
MKEALGPFFARPQKIRHEKWANRKAGNEEIGRK